MSAPEDQEDTLDEVFVGEDGDDIGDGRVVADLDDGNGGVDEEDEEPAIATGEDRGEEEEQEQVEEMSEHCFEGHTDPVVSVAWSPTGADLVATGGCDDKAYIWRVGQDAYHETGGETFELAGHTDTICSLAFDSTGARLATGGMDGKVKVWCAASGALLSTLEGPGGAIEWACWHPRGGVVLAGAEDFTAWMWLAETGACMQVFSGHNGPVTCGTFTADGRSVITGGGENDSSLRVWNPKTGECSVCIQGSSRTFHEDAITALDVHADCQTVLTGSADGRAFLTNIASGRVVGALEGHSDSIEAVAFCPVLPLATTAGVDGLVKVWDQQTLSMRGECEHPGPLTTLKCHPSQPLVITGCLDGAVRVWDLRTAARTACLTGHSDGVQAIALSPDGSMVISGGDDNQARVFKLQQ